MKSRVSKYLLPILLLCTTGFSYGRQLRAVPDSVARNVKKDAAFWYANDPSFWTKDKPSSGLLTLIQILSSDILKWTVYALLAAALTFVTYRIILTNSFFAPRRSRKNTEKKEKHPHDASENIDEQIVQAIAANEYRLATRFYYLKTLSILNSEKKIALHARSTNDEYVRQMSAHSNANDFRKLTNIYEYVWYGEFQPSASQFEMIRARFNQFNRYN